MLAVRIRGFPLNRRLQRDIAKWFGWRVLSVGHPIVLFLFSDALSSA
jgi:hypothetical protein